MSDLITSQMLSDWRANYGLDKRTPIKAMHWWQDNMDGKAPAGVVAALGLCINEIERLTAELETERMRLTACGVAALANTADSAARARDIRPEYRSASLDDVERAVDREIQLRDERDELRRQLVEARAEREAMANVLPGVYYMDPPDGGDVSLLKQLQRMSNDAARYRLLRRKFAIISDGEGNAEFCPINLPRPTYIAPNTAIELDTALDRERLGLDGAKRPPTPVGWSDTDWIKHLQEQAEQPHPLAGQHINQGSMDAAADAYEAEYYDALKRDARRYRWLRGDSCPDHSVRWTQWEVRCWNAPQWTADLRRSELDAAIDAAMGSNMTDALKEPRDQR